MYYYCYYIAVLEILINIVRKEKSFSDLKGKIKLQLFILKYDNMHRKNNRTNNLLQLMIKLSKVIRNKVNIHKFLTFFYTSASQQRVIFALQVGLINLTNQF